MKGMFKDGLAEMMVYGFGETKFGLVLVGLSDLGVRTILFGNNRQSLAREAAEIFPDTKLVEGDTSHDQAIAKVVAHIDQPSTTLDIPVDLRGSTLQIAVWRALCEIPSGQTTSYGKVAKSLPGTPSARAVAAACAANVLAVAVPCHRVISADGSLSGYRWAMERKRLLLENERAFQLH